MQFISKKNDTISTNHDKKYLPLYETKPLHGLSKKTDPISGTLRTFSSSETLGQMVTKTKRLNADLDC